MGPGLVNTNWGPGPGTKQRARDQEIQIPQKKKPTKLAILGCLLKLRIVQYSTKQKKRTFQGPLNAHIF